MTRLALGTVQFGKNYGVANNSGQTNLSEATKIITLAKKASVDLIDTAISYGNSEKIIGEVGITDFRFVGDASIGANTFIYKQSSWIVLGQAHHGKVHVWIQPGGSSLVSNTAFHDCGGWGGANRKSPMGDAA